MRLDLSTPPRAPIHHPMSYGEFRDVPRHPGWKYEYADGRIHVTTAFVVVPLVLEPRPAGEPPTAWREVPGATLRPLAAAYDGALARLFARAFAGTMEYVGATPDTIRASAAECLTRGPRKRRGPRLASSCVAEAGGELVGAALFRGGAGAPLLDLVFVSPKWRRRGLASALFARAAAHFAAVGERRIRSAVMLGNEPSLAWHLRSGFRERPHLLVAQHRFDLYRYELDRHRRLRDLSPAALADLEDIAAYWEVECRRLETLFAEDPAAAFPSMY